MSQIKSTILGFPRMGVDRELKKSLESYWKGEIDSIQLSKRASELKSRHWQLQKDKGLSEIVVNDFSYYDHVLDLTHALGIIPPRYEELKHDSLRLYFAMARGEKGDSSSVTAMEMSKWFDTNYHYIVPELSKDIQMELSSELKVLHEIKEAQQVLGSDVVLRPVLLGPVSYLSLSKTTDATEVLEYLPNILEVYVKLLELIQSLGIDRVQIDEPVLTTDISEAQRQAFIASYKIISEKLPTLKVFLASYFDELYENAELISTLPVDTVHVDLLRGSESSLKVLGTSGKKLSLGLIDGRNIWRADISEIIARVQRISSEFDTELYVSSSCSLLHSPVDLSRETELDSDIRSWLSFAVQKIEEIALVVDALNGNPDHAALEENARALKNRKESPKVHKQEVKHRVKGISSDMASRKSPFSTRIALQQQRLDLPLFPTTTIGSFPQTPDIRKIRAAFKNKKISLQEYQNAMKTEIKRVVDFQEQIGLDVLVHGEPERNDMVEYFGENFEGYVSTKNGWVQSYGSRCVKPPVIYGDLTRPRPITVEWSSYAQTLTQKPMKGMLTGPVTILQWSFVRDDQPRSETCFQLALLIRDEVQDLEKAGIGVIQVDEPAIREGLPLRKRNHAHYLEWAVKSFKVSTCGVEDETQIHTHMCYSEFNEIIEAISALDADVISVEASRSRMELLEAFKDFKYPNGIGPGVYDIHSPRVPSKEEILRLLNYALPLIDKELLWVNPDCGLKTRTWEEVKPSLQNLVEAAKELREKV